MRAKSRRGRAKPDLLNLPPEAINDRANPKRFAHLVRANAEELRMYFLAGQKLGEKKGRAPGRWPKRIVGSPPAGPTVQSSTGT